MLDQHIVLNSLTRADVRDPMTVWSVTGRGGRFVGYPRYNTAVVAVLTIIVPGPGNVLVKVTADLEILLFAACNLRSSPGLAGWPVSMPVGVLDFDHTYNIPLVGVGVYPDCQRSGWDRNNVFTGVRNLYNGATMGPSHKSGDHRIIRGPAVIEPRVVA